MAPGDLSGSYFLGVRAAPVVGLVPDLTNPKTIKFIFVASLLNTHHQGVRPKTS